MHPDQAALQTITPIQKSLKMKKTQRRSLATSSLLLLSLLAGSVWAQSNETEFEYDARGRLIQISNSAGDEATFSFDLAGNRTSLSITTSAPQITSFLAPDEARYSDPALGNIVTLLWTSAGTSSCVLSGTAISGTHNHSANDSTMLQITQSGTLVLTCSAGAVSDVVTKNISLVPATS